MQLLGVAGGPVFKGQLPTFLWSAFYSGGIRAVERLADGDTPTQVYDAIIETARVQMEVEAELDRNQNRLISSFNTRANTQWAHRRAESRTLDQFRASLQKALLRLSKMLRLNKAADFKPLCDAALDLPPPELTRLVSELNRTGIDDGWAIVLMFSPTLLQHVQGDKTTSALTESERLRVGLKSLVKLYDMARHSLELRLHVHNAQLDSQAELNRSDSEDGDSPAANGIYEVDCYQLTTWAKSTTILQRITKDWNRSVFLEHSLLMGDLGEATVNVKPQESRTKRKPGLLMPGF
jgi:hypothetical protein